MTAGEKALKALQEFKLKHSVEPNVVFMNWVTYWKLRQSLGAMYDVHFSDVSQFMGIPVGISPFMGSDVFEFRKEK